MLANVYQCQASQPELPVQGFLLTHRLIHHVVKRFRLSASHAESSSVADHVVVRGDFNASLQCRKGYVGLPHILTAKERLALHIEGTANSDKQFSMDSYGDLVWAKKTCQMPHSYAPCIRSMHRTVSTQNALHCVHAARSMPRTVLKRLMRCRKPLPHPTPLSLFTSKEGA